MGKARKNPVADAQILESYDANRSAYVTARTLGISATTVERVLTKNKIARTGLDDYRKRITRFQGQEADIRGWYDAGETLDQIRVRLGGASDYSIKHAVRRAGGTIRENQLKRVSDSDVAEIRKMNADGMSQMRISIAMGRSQSFVGRAMMIHGIKTLDRRGSVHSQWKGGRSLTQGYIRVWIDHRDPLFAMADSSGYVLEHRLVKARSLGRPLLTSETVHHIDGDRTNNADANLQLRYGRHGKGSALRCLDCGSRNVGSEKLH